MDIVNIMDSHQLRRAKLLRQGCVLCAARLIQPRRTGAHRACRSTFINGELVTRFGEFIRERKQENLRLFVNPMGKTCIIWRRETCRLQTEPT